MNYGTSGTGPYFEGWYWKHQNPRGQTLALIPAFHIDGDGCRTASLQIISKDQSWWLEYPEAQLQVSRRPPVLNTPLERQIPENLSGIAFTQYISGWQFGRSVV